MIKAVIFDLDDTLISESEYIKSGFESVSKEISNKYNLDYKDMIKNTTIINNEHVRNNININSSMSDVIYKYKNKIFIIEMNNDYTKESLYKNHFYLFFSIFSWLQDASDRVRGLFYNY